MKKYTLFASVLLVVTALFAQATDRPEFVKASLANFNGNSNYKARAAWARPFGWGTGTYHIADGKEIPFTWFAWSNTDGYFQMSLSTQVYSFDLQKIRGMKDDLKRPFNASSTKSETYIGLTNDWAVADNSPFCKILPETKDGHNWACDNPSILAAYLAGLSKVVPQLQFRMVETMR